jgi:hypothetical protein
MDEPASRPDAASSFRELAEKTLLAGLGLLDAAREQAQGAAGPGSGGQPLRERAQSALAGFAADLGFVGRERFEELELKVAQLEHRLRLLEAQGEVPASAPPASEPPASES